MKNFYVTTAIHYANASPHLGHAYENVASDVIARWHRLQGEQTFFLSGTDEHGVKNVRSAENAGKQVEDFVAQKREEYKILLKELHASNDFFIYTADQKVHWPGAIKMWETLAKNDDFYKAAYKGLYCVGHEAFVTEKDLVDGVCADHQKKPEIVEEENYFFKLSKYVSEIKKAISSDTLKIYPETRKKEILSFLEEKVQDVSFSRPSKDIKWGVPVPGDSSQTMYVWCDALVNYISALGYGSSDESKFETFWPCDVHVIGKDILRFHAVIWPAMLLSAKLPLPKSIFVHGMIRSAGQKMSKTIGNVIDPFEIIHEYGADAFRFFLMREIPFGEDGDFTRERFAAVYEGSLAHGIGNLASRTATMVEKYFDGKLEQPSDEEIELTQMLGREEISLQVYFSENTKKQYEKMMNRFELTSAITVVSNFFSALDSYIQENEPFRLFKENPQKTNAVLWNVATHIAMNAELLIPFMPETAEDLKKAFAIQKDGSVIVKKPKALFPSKK